MASSIYFLAFKLRDKAKIQCLFGYVNRIHVTTFFIQIERTNSVIRKPNADVHIDIFIVGQKNLFTSHVLRIYFLFYYFSLHIFVV